MNCLLCRFIHIVLSLETTKRTVMIVTKVRFMPLPPWFLGLAPRFPYTRHVRSARASAIVARHESGAEGCVCQAVMPPLERLGKRHEGEIDARGVRVKSRFL